MNNKQDNDCQKLTGLFYDLDKLKMNLNLLLTEGEGKNKDKLKISNWS